MIDATNENADAITAEKARAVARENEIEKTASDNLATAKAELTNKISETKTELTENLVTAKKDLIARVNTETLRAQTAEEKLQASLDTEITRAKDSEESLQTDIVNIRGHPTDDETETTLNGIKKLVDKTYEIANSKSSGFSFLTIDDLISGKGSNLSDYSKVHIGDNVFIVETGVCDFWVSAISLQMPVGFKVSTRDEIKAIADGQFAYAIWGNYYVTLVGSEGKDDVDEKIADIKDENNSSYEVRTGQISDYTPKRNYDITYTELITSNFTVSVPDTKDIKPAFNNGFNFTTGSNEVSVTLNSTSHVIVILNGLVWEYENNTFTFDEKRKVSSMFVFNGADWYWYITEVEITWTT